MVRNFRKLGLVCLFCLAVTSCVKVTDKDENRKVSREPERVEEVSKEEQQEQIEEVASSDEVVDGSIQVPQAPEDEMIDDSVQIPQAPDYQLSGQIVSGDNLHEYQVELRASTSHPERLLKTVGGKFSGYLDWPKDQESFIDAVVESGDELHYQFVDDKEEILAEVELAVPTDLEIKGRMILKENTVMKVGRLYLAEGSLVQTNEHDLEIEAELVIAGKGARIINFPLDKEPREFKKGRAGGNISITATRAHGDLDLVLTGEPGSQGQAGSQDVSKLHGVQGAAGKRGNVNQGDHALLYVCTEPPGNGGPGTAGKDGDAGKPGFDGGATGSLVIDIDQGEELRLFVQRIPGAPGPGGPGGPGGTGGPGGVPGLVYSKRAKSNAHPVNPLFGKACDPAQPGKPGPNGAQGPEGPPGAVGAVGKQCIRLRLAEQFLCE